MRSQPTSDTYDSIFKPRSRTTHSFGNGLFFYQFDFLLVSWKTGVVQHRKFYAILLTVIVSVCAISVLSVLNQRVYQEQVKYEQKTRQAQPTMSYQAFNGSLYFTDFSGQRELIIEPASLAHDRLRPQSIVEYSLAPSGSQLALFVEIGTNEYGIYVIEADGAHPRFVGLATSIRWSPDSRYLAYTSRQASEALPRLFVYDTNSEKNFESDEKRSECFLSYFDFGWKDSQNILTHFQCLSEAPYGNVVEEGEMEVAVRDLNEVQTQ